MRQYVVTEGCYVPVGESTKFKRAGQVVTLDEADAKALGGLVKPASEKLVATQVAGQTRVQADGVGDPGPEPSASENTVVADADDDDAPAQSATKSEWVDYAVSKGEDREAVEAMTKADLVDKFG